MTLCSKRFPRNPRYYEHNLLSFAINLDFDLAVYKDCNLCHSAILFAPDCIAGHKKQQFSIRSKLAYFMMPKVSIQYYQQCDVTPAKVSTFYCYCRAKSADKWLHCSELTYMYNGSSAHGQGLQMCQLANGFLVCSLKLKPKPHACKLRYTKRKNTTFQIIHVVFHSILINASHSSTFAQYCCTHIEIKA